MRIFRKVCAAVMGVTLMAGSVRAADRAVAVSEATLKGMGFGAARVMTDAEGTAVRGRGHFAFAMTFLTVNSLTKTRMDFAPPGHTASTSAFLTNGTLFASGSSFAFAK